MSRSAASRGSSSSTSASSSSSSSSSTPSSLPPPRTPDSDVPHFTIDLDGPIASRWSSVVSAYKRHWSGMVEEMWREYEENAEAEEREQEKAAAAAARKKGKGKKKGKRGDDDDDSAMTDSMPPPSSSSAPAAERTAARRLEHESFASTLASNLLSGFRAHGLALYADEFEHVARESGIQLRDLVLLNLSYEAHGGCTTILAPTITQDENGKSRTSIIMGRTLDWLQPALRHVTIEVSFMRGSELLYRATTFAGFLGIFTGHRPHAYAIAVNFRMGEEGEEDDDDGTGAAPWPIGFLVRHTLESCPDFTSAVSVLERAPLMAPAYFSVCGIRAHEAIMITRDTNRSIKPMHIRRVHVHEHETWDDKGNNNDNGDENDDALTLTSQCHMEVDDAVMESQSEDKKTKRKAPSKVSSRVEAKNGDAARAPASSSSRSFVQMLRSYLPGFASSSSASSSRAAATSSLSSSSSLSSFPPSSSAPSAHHWLVQANMDHWLHSTKLDHQCSLPRTKLVHTHLTKLTKASGSAGGKGKGWMKKRNNMTAPVAVSEEDMWVLMGQEPIWDDETIYATVAIPSTDTFITRIENQYPQVKGGKQGKAHKGGGKRGR